MQSPIPHRLPPLPDLIPLLDPSPVPLSQSQQDMHHGHIHTHDHQHGSNSTQNSAAMRVCRRCHDALVAAFDHCLVRRVHDHDGPPETHDKNLFQDTKPDTISHLGNNKPSLDNVDSDAQLTIGAALASVRTIDETADSVPLNDAPCFDIIRDPSRDMSTVFVDAHEAVDRDRWVMQQQQVSSIKHESYGKAVRGITGNADTALKPSTMGNSGDFGIPPTKHIKGIGIQSGHVFSGAIYKRMLEAKDREIASLRSNLYTTTRHHQFQIDNVNRLRMALSRSVYYYTFAEEWQKSESERLIMDVRILKTEVSSLMAFLIHAEDEKRRLRSQIHELHDVIRVRDEKVKDAENQVSEMKLKLHDSFKEFMRMDETMSRLRREAVKGTEAAESRNTILQRNLEKLSADFEVSAKELGTSQTRIRELEFELEELVQQFNMTGESKKRSEELNVKISAELDDVTIKLKESMENIQQLTMQRSKLEADLLQMELQSETVKKDLEAQIAKLSEEIEIAMVNKKELEAHLKSSRSENEKLATALKSLTRSKDQLEAASKAMAQKHEKEIAIRDQRIKELGDLRTEDAKMIKKMQEQKEQLMFQTTDLQNQLDRELANVNVLTFEIAQIKRLSDEKSALLDEQIEKLTAAKQNLSNDKRQLTEKIKFVRTDLRQKEEELETTKTEFEQHRQQATATETQLRQELATLTESHSQLSKEYKSLEGKHHMVVDMSVKLKMKQDQLQKSHAGLESELSSTRAEADHAKSEVERLTKELSVEKEQHTSVQMALDTMTGRAEDLSQRIDTLRTETTEEIHTRNEEIKRLSELLFQCQQENAHHTETIQRYVRTVATLESQLAQTQSNLAAETAHREQLETALFENRVAFQNERKLRVEFERLQMHVRARQTQRELDIYEEWHKRDRKLIHISTGLHTELDRLSSLAKLLPKADMLGNMQLANTKEFEWLLNDDKEVAGENKSRKHKSKRKHGRKGPETIQE